MVSDTNPRQIAARILWQRLSSGEFTENLLETALAANPLSAPDRGLCHELVCGVVRWQGTLDCLIARKTDPSRQPRPAVINLLRLGLYQIFWLDRIPPHAAVHETVEETRRAGYGAQAGFINAVLRGYLREAEEIRKILADMKISQPALGWSHPEWLAEKWRQAFGEEPTRRLMEWDNTPPKTYARVNALKFAAEGERSGSVSGEPGAVVKAPRMMKGAGDLVTRWREEGVEYDFFTRDWIGENVAFELKSHASLARLGTFQDGWFYVQDPGTLLAPVWLGVQPGERVWDMCAAPGGKTTFIAQLLDNQGRLVASDVDPGRLRLVKENCARLGVTCVEIRTSGWGEAGDVGGPGAGEPFDKILVDAPCSNTGVLRRRVDLRWRLQRAEIERLRGTQLKLLTQAAAALKPGGALVYSTCSLEREENQEVVQQFLASHANFHLDKERQVTPFTDGVDGAYVARLKKTD